MGPGNSNVPDLPWFSKPDIPSMSIVTTMNTEENTLILPYIQYALIDHEPMLLETKKRAEEVFEDCLYVGAKNHLPLPSSIDDMALKDLYTDYPFNWTLNLALYHLGDAGVITDVYQYRSAYLKLKFMKQKSRRIAQILEAV
jgi:hypothetical protein